MKTSLPGDTVSNHNSSFPSYTHDNQDTMAYMLHLSSIDWDYQEQVREVDLGGGSTKWYIYVSKDVLVRIYANGPKAGKYMNTIVLSSNQMIKYGIK